MVQGDSITFEGQDLVACRNDNGSCEVREMPMRCALFLPSHGCRGVGLGDPLPCRGYPVIFVPRKKYLELRLMGDA